MARTCPNCGKDISQSMRNKTTRQRLIGGWTCAYCGYEVDYVGRVVNQGAVPQQDLQVFETQLAKISAALPAQAASGWQHLCAEFLLTKHGYELALLNDILVQQRISLAHYTVLINQTGWEIVTTTPAHRAVPKQWVSINDMIHGTTNQVVDAMIVMCKRQQP